MGKSKDLLSSEKVQSTIKNLVQQTLREALEAELGEFLGYSKYQRINGQEDSRNYRNGHLSIELCLKF